MAAAHELPALILYLGPGALAIVGGAAMAWRRSARVRAAREDRDTREQPPHPDGRP